MNDVKHELSAYETVVYINHSPNELREIYFHLWPNAYKNTETALANQFYARGDRRMLDADEKNLGFIDSLNFTVDGETVQWKYDSTYIDICKLILNRPLKNGDSISISTPFRVKIPSAEISRMGHIGQAYYISQWYPKPAVYDRYGWHPIPYLDQGEFYSEFGSFDVSITLPKNYVVGATGDLQTEEEKIFLEEKAKEGFLEKKPKGTILHKDLTFPASDAESKTIRFIQTNVHDFAWFADKRYQVMKSEVELPASKRKVNTWIMFTENEMFLWKDALEYLNNAMYYYSLWVGDYPFNNITAVDGTISAGGGMEYPNITIIGECGTARLLELTIAHEAGHNWFYGILGSNERENPWMDEGINQFCELRYSEAVKRKNESLLELGTIGKLFGIDTLTDKTIDEFGYLISARSNTDQPLNLHSEKFSSTNYGTCVYYKTALSFNYLKAYLGDSLFDRCMQTYYEKWKFKHPSPADVRSAFEETSQKNLSWFFDDLLGTTKKVNYKIVSLKESEITLKNTGGVSGPVPVSTVKDGKIISTQWTEGFVGTKKLNLPAIDFDKIIIDADRSIPEINRKNNSIRNSGMLRKWDKPNFKFLGGFEKPSVSQVFYMPVLGWNNYDKVMAGLAFHNIFIPEKKFEYILMPMYSTRTSTFVGGGNVSYNFYPGSKTGKERWVRKMTLELGAQSYHFRDFINTTVDHSIAEEKTFRFSKVVPGITFYFNPAEKNTGRQSSLALKVSHVKYETDVYQPCISCLSGDSSEFFYRIINEEKYFPEILYSITRSNGINPSSAFVGARYITKDDVMRVFGEVNYRFSYKGRNRGFDIRMFAGAVTNSGGVADYRLRMSGYIGANDYMFNHIFLGRSESEGILSKQFVVAEGGFKTPTATGQSNSWLTAINLKTSIPTRLPVKLFADIGWYGKESTSPDNRNFMYDYGFELTIIPNAFSIYIPIGFSQDIKDYYEVNEARFGNWYDKIRYEIRFEKLNPLKLIRSIEL